MYVLNIRHFTVLETILNALSCHLATIKEGLIILTFPVYLDENIRTDMNFTARFEW